jgi:hypothetical protein
MTAPALRALGLLLGMAWSQATSASDCEVLRHPPMLSHPIPEIAHGASFIDAAHEARTRAWWTYAESVRARELRCTTASGERYYYDGEELLRRVREDLEVILRDGKPHLVIYQDDYARIVQLLEDGVPRYGELHLLRWDDRRYWEYPGTGEAGGRSE